MASLEGMSRRGPVELVGVGTRPGGYVRNVVAVDTRGVQQETMLLMIVWRSYATIPPSPWIVEVVVS